MKLYVCRWPDGDVSLVAADNAKDLFWSLDELGDPYECEIHQVPATLLRRLNLAFKPEVTLDGFIQFDLTGDTGSLSDLMELLSEHAFPAAHAACWKSGGVPDPEKVKAALAEDITRPTRDEEGRSKFPWPSYEELTGG